MSNLLSDRINSIKPSATIAMATKAAELKAQGVDVISLSLGEPDFKTPKHIQEGAKKAIDAGTFFSYPPVPGYPALRKAIATKLKRDNNIDAEMANIVVSAGAKHSIANVLSVLVNKGDEVVIFSPYWVSYADLVVLYEGTPVFVEGSLENNFIPTKEELAAVVTDKTKVVMYSSPCNPTGSTFTTEDMEGYADVLRDKDLIVLADEIYEYIVFGEKAPSMASLPGMFEKTATVNGFAKGYAMTGWRVGYICAPEWLAKATTKLQSQVTSGISSIAQQAALTAVTEDLTPTFDMVKAYEKRRGIVYDLLQDVPGWEINMPTGAFYFFPDVSSYFGKSFENYTINDSEDLALYLLAEAAVSTVGGGAFGAPNNLRLSYAASEENLIEAVKRIKETLAKLA